MIKYDEHNRLCMVWMEKCEEIFVKIVKEMERQGIMKILSFINFCIYIHSYFVL